MLCERLVFPKPPLDASGKYDPESPEAIAWAEECAAMVNKLRNKKDCQCADPDNCEC